MLLPQSVRYVKNGAGGRWWSLAKRHGQIHAGFSNSPDEALLACDLGLLQKLIQQAYGSKQGATQDFNQLKTLLVNPSQHLWVTFQDGDLWWCTVRDGITVQSGGETFECGHFWLTCATPWSNFSLNRQRHLAMSTLPGLVTATAGFKGTVCEPRGSHEIVRIISNLEDEDVKTASLTRQTFVTSVIRLVNRLGPRDFELLVDLILSRTGWVRIAKLGGATEGIDIEAENIAVGEIAFVQVKSRATQRVLDEYVLKFSDRRDRYHRMIFAVHKPDEQLRSPTDLPVKVWNGHDIAELVVQLGLSDWVASRI